MPDRKPHILSNEGAEGYAEPPVYPQLTRSQWAVLSAMTDKNCTDMIAATAFYSELSEDAKDFLKGADEAKVALLNSNLTFFSNSRVIWKFLWVGGGMFFAAVMGVAGFMKLFGDYISVKLK